MQNACFLWNSRFSNDGFLKYFKDFSSKLAGLKVQSHNAWLSDCLCLLSHLSYLLMEVKWRAEPWDLNHNRYSWHLVKFFNLFEVQTPQSTFSALQWIVCFSHRETRMWLFVGICLNVECIIQNHPVNNWIRILNRSFPSCDDLDLVFILKSLQINHTLMTVVFECWHTFMSWGDSPTRVWAQLKSTCL